MARERDKPRPRGKQTGGRGAGRGKHEDRTTRERREYLPPEPPAERRAPGHEESELEREPRG